MIVRLRLHATEIEHEVDVEEEEVIEDEEEVDEEGIEDEDLADEGVIMLIMLNCLSYLRPTCISMC